VPSAKRPPQIAVLALCGAIGVGSLAGCETTQEKAEAQRAESERILDARAKRQAQKKKHKQGDEKQNRNKHHQQSQQKGEG
jgi:hypothetical protein